MEINDKFVEAKRGDWWQFPVQMGIEIIGGKDYIVEHRFNGLAQAGREGEVVVFGGWAKNQACRLVGSVNWTDGNKVFPYNTLELFVLRGRLIMN
jgi:hypothetical protein